ncbi:MAG: biotin/lipoyl-containing protein, partial [Myxococcota bacterium]
PREINDEDPNKGIEAAKARLEAEGLAVTDESIFIASALLDKGIAFLKGEGPLGVRYKSSETGVAPTETSDRFTVTVRGRSYEVQLDGDDAVIDGVRYPFAVAIPGSKASGRGAAPGGAQHEVRSELPAKVLRVLVKEGDTVKAGQALLVLEALKMEIEIASPADGRVTSIAVAAGSQVAAGALLAAVA